ncbi:serine/threonine protein kinase [Nocardia tenerifensis]|uniref:Serine/threonine protein kinase n=1 Tax=Nocardia tenerifensis TaxID=228006 RepID=A0A318K6N5_9NOCA|nr:serine/threonine-protein kinase [Nocardia tenerifensis]PXX68354.1 serine/threonine protein kinase [Nocardia tenerifensis]
MVTRLEPGDPDRIGRYRLLGQLGSGGMGRVLLGVGPDGRLVAIKQVHQHLVTEEDFLPRFRREVQTSAQVSGAFTAAVIDFDVESEDPWLASVFVPGVPLDKAVKDYGPLTPDEVHKLAIGLASALQAIHGVGLVHRDLKPANVILAEDGPRVIDFGIARAVEGRSELTHTGSIIGSPAFMSPEQAQSLPLTPASDIFSLGAVLAMAAGGASPFAGSSLPHTLYNIVHTEPDLSGLPTEVRELVSPCLRKEPSERPTPAQLLDFLGPLPPQHRPWSAQVHRAIGEQQAEMAALLADPEATQIVGAEPAHAGAQSVDDFEQRLRALVEIQRAGALHRRRKRVLIAASAVVVLVAGVLAGTALFGGDDEEPTGPVANPLAALNLTKLRSIDLCAAVQEPLVSSLGEWTNKPGSTQWGTCAAEAGGYRFDLDIKRVEGYRDNGQRAAGVPVLEDVAGGTDSCGRALLPAKTDPQFGIAVRVKGAESGKLCGVADEAVDELARRMVQGPPQLPSIRNSLARHDPCALVDSIVVKLNIGDKVRGTADSLHNCKWVANDTTTVSLERSKTLVPTEKPIPFDFGGGNIVFLDEAELQSRTCIRQAEYRRIDGGEAEVVTVRVDNSSTAEHPEFRCLGAQKVLQNIFENLPQVG